MACRFGDTRPSLWPKLAESKICWAADRAAARMSPRTLHMVKRRSYREDGTTSETNAALMRKPGVVDQVW